MAKPTTKKTKTSVKEADVISEKLNSPEVSKFIKKHSDNINMITSAITAILFAGLSMWASLTVLQALPILFPLSATAASLIYLFVTFYRLFNNKGK